jgi:hypothetical protein
MRDGMPVLRQYTRGKVGQHGIYGADDGVSIEHGQCAIWAKIILNVNDDQRFIGWSHGKSPSASNACSMASNIPKG